MHLRFINHQLAVPTDVDEDTRDVYASSRSLPDGLPVLLDDRWRPVDPWQTYFRIIAGSTSTSTV